MSAETRKLIGQRIREAREELGLTQSELGEQLNKSYKTISGHETGTYMPKIEEINVIAHTLRKPIGYFFDEDMDDSFSTQINRLRPEFRKPVFETIKVQLRAQESFDHALKYKFAQILAYIKHGASELRHGDPMPDTQFIGNEATESKKRQVVIEYDAETGTILQGQDDLVAILDNVFHNQQVE